ncbi:recombinase family protein [Glaciimonas sp. CA11.2]|uniref:recombinase family protein n=1 Tax=Glaciimonas sp. CA11.2 TaxID=3048601 RepID=UPI002AB3E50E|nr:recombinase family protein [Glaciimonas sp. CA11.2]MDY7545490.1 recombinase family protein [Glaciimonas sp. CA11.2]MEB0163066.1 recombinase family protein [Glaciimonas sp. CA11.2]
MLTSFSYCSTNYFLNGGLKTAADLQRDALTNARCVEIYEEKARGKSADRPELGQCLRGLRTSDTFVFWRLDRLRRSLPDLFKIIVDL